MRQALIWEVIRGLILLRFSHLQHINPENLVMLLKEKKNQQMLILDARTPSEYKVSHLKNAELVPQRLEDLKQLLRVTDSTPIVVYCSIGYRSAIIVNRLKQLGYSQAFNLNGSLFEWASKGYPVYDGEKSVRVIHAYNRWWKGFLEKSLPGYKCVLND